MKLAVACASGIEAVTKREMLRLGVENAPAINGRILFDGDEKTVADCNLFLRTASRVYIVLGEFKAQSFDELFEGTFAIDWKHFLPVDANIVVVAKCVHSTIHAISVTQSIVKKAICEKMNLQFKNAVLSENGARYKIEVSIVKDFCVVSLDTSGEGLHRRGYRNLVGNAPLKENVASALVQLSVWNPSRPFFDLFCGSGTLPIEAALIAKGIPSGAKRNFDFLNWKNFDNSYFYKQKQLALDNLNDVSNVRISGFDVDDKALALARKHAVNAGVDDLIHFQRADMRDFSSKLPSGVVVSNPPYGERLEDRFEIEKLYTDYGRLARKHNNYCFYTLTPVTDFERLFGRRCEKKRKIYNGNIECFFYSHLAPKLFVKKNND